MSYQLDITHNHTNGLWAKRLTAFFYFSIIMKNYFSPDYDAELLPQELRKLDNLDGLTQVARVAFKSQIDTGRIDGWRENANELGDSQRDEDLQVAVRFTIAKLVAQIAYSQKDESLDEVSRPLETVIYKDKRKITSDPFELIRPFVDDAEPLYYV